jgi:DNA-binding transcriptional LysR family regulator
MNAAPSWDLYRTFLAILQEGSLSGAARALGLTQLTIVRHLDALEAWLGLELFVRSPQGLSPTEAALELGPMPRCWPRPPPRCCARPRATAAR